jgi:hypothetical protein
MCLLDRSAVIGGPQRVHLLTEPKRFDTLAEPVEIRVVRLLRRQFEVLILEDEPIE